MSPDSDSPTQHPTDGEALKPTPFTNPIQFLAFGFGSGLSPKGPGTAGTLAAIPLYWFMADLNLLAYSAVVLLAFIVGVYL
ncbi:MAG: phosphatidylglycerophosphatase A, partial [Halieaceae bacterium]